MESIFVSIASYNDSDINMTINDCFQRASNPERVWVGVLLQESNKRVIDDFQLWLESFKWKSNVILKTHHKALGCGGARNIIMNELYNDSDYFWCIDSHSRFLQNWDTEYISLYKELPAKGVISVFPLPYEFGQPYEEYALNDVPPSIYIPNAPVWTNDFNDPQCKIPVTSKFEKVITISGGNLFGSGDIVDVIKVGDWKFHSQRDQEVYSLLLYKAGYDVFATNKSFIFHKYVHSYEATNGFYRELPNVNIPNYIDDFIGELVDYGIEERSYLMWLSEYYKACDECRKLKLNEKPI